MQGAVSIALPSVFAFFLLPALHCVVALAADSSNRLLLAAASNLLFANLIEKTSKMDYRTPTMTILSMA
jgi:hypothetical protein